MYSAPGKLILAGEHAVVYGQPAIAIPLQALRATVAIEAAADGAGLTVHAPDLGAVWRLRAQAPLSDLAERTLRLLDVPEPDATLTITSTIPIASGMGSGAAVGAALVRALAGLVGRPLEAATVSDLVYESERAFHGTPSGIDNTVVAYEQPIIFQRRPAGPPAITPLAVGGPWHFVVGDTGVASETRAVVGDLRRRWQADPGHYEGGAAGRRRPGPRPAAHGKSGPAARPRRVFGRAGWAGRGGAGGGGLGRQAVRRRLGRRDAGPGRAGRVGGGRGGAAGGGRDPRVGNRAGRARRRIILACGEAL